MLQLLQGIRVVECASLFGGLTGRILGDLGAEVIKVETPRFGDPMRDWPQPVTPHQSAFHLVTNRNKRSITLDLRSDAGKEVFFDLIRAADVFVDGFPGDTADRLGIGYQAQCAVKPDIVYAQFSGFGAGPYASLPTHGFMMGGLAGGVELEMGDDDLPVELSVTLGDGSAVASQFNALTVVAAIVQRDRTGQGARIDTAGSDAALATAWMVPVLVWNENKDPEALEASGGARYRSYQTKDERYVLFCCAEQKLWNNFCNGIDRPDMLDTREDAPPMEFGVGDVDLMHKLQEIFRTRTQAEWMDLALSARVALSPANQMEDLLGDRHLQTREIIHEDIHPVAGRYVATGWPAMVQGQPFEIARQAPALGEHTDEVLGELGYDAARIASLHENRVV